jgi:tetratricopeptide (TPR) repeat protein
MEAAPHLEVAAEDGQGLDRAWLFLGDIWALAGRPAEAERRYRQYLKANPPALEILVALGDVVAEQGRVAEARAIYEQADAPAPGSEMIAKRLKTVGR